MAAKKTVKVDPENKVVVEQKVVRPEGIKYRCDFKSYKEYTNYKGVKG